MCGDNQETIIRTLHDCSIATKVSEKGNNPNYLSHIFNLDILDWIINNLNDDFGGNDAQTILVGMMLMRGSFSV